MEFFLVTIYFLAFCLIIKRSKLFSNSNLSFSFLSAILLLKVVCGSLLGWIYANYYNEGDTFHYIHDANVFQSLLIQHPFDYFKAVTGLGTADASFYSQLTLWNDSGLTSLYNDTRTLIRVNAIIRIFSFGYYAVHVLFMSFISLCGLMMLYRTAIYYSSQNEKLIRYAVFCIPSVLLWGSGLMKEPLQLFAMCLVLWSFHKTTLNASVKNILYFIIAMMVLFFTRTYIFLAFVPGLIAWTIYLHYKKINCFVLFVACYAIMLTIALQLKHILPQYDIALMLYEKQIVYYKNAIVYNAQSLIPRITFAPSPTSVVKRSPEAVWLVLSQPYLWQSKSIWYYFSAIENILLIALIIYALIKLDRKVIRENPLFAFSICFCITLFIIIGLTTPVVGAIVRYKVSGLLMLVVAIVSMKGSTLIGTSKPEV